MRGHLINSGDRWQVDLGILIRTHLIYLFDRGCDTMQDVSYGNVASLRRNHGSYQTVQEKHICNDARPSNISEGLVSERLPWMIFYRVHRIHVTWTEDPMIGPFNNENTIEIQIFEQNQLHLHRFMSQS